MKQTQKRFFERYIGRLEFLAWIVTCAASIVLATTGIGSYLSGHVPMQRWVLMMHVAVAPAFAVGLAALSLTVNLSDLANTRIIPLVVRWLLLICGLLVIVSGILPMTPLFGTAGQHFLYLAHRYLAVSLVVLLFLHFLADRRRLGIRQQAG